MLQGGNLRAYHIHQTLRVLGETTWRFYQVPDDPVEAEALRLRLMVLETENHPPPDPERGKHG